MAEDVIGKIRDCILQALSEFEPYVIYVFGSAAKGTIRKDSDIDLAFLSDKEIEDHRVFMKAQEIAEKLGMDVDLINLKKSSTVFALQVITEGVVIFSKHEGKKMEFEMYTLSDYVRLNEERATVLRDWVKNNKKS